MIGIYAIIGGVDVSADVITAHTNQHAAYQDDQSPSKCVFTLHNPKQKYGKLIASGTWQPMRILVSSIVWVERNINTTGARSMMGDGYASNSPHDAARYSTVLDWYTFFIGYATKFNFDEETATIECECAASLLCDAMTKDRSWKKTDTIQAKVQDICNDNARDKRGVNIIVEDRRAIQTHLNRNDYVTSDQSALQGIYDLARDHNSSFYTPSDDATDMLAMAPGSEGHGDKLILYEYHFVTGDYELDPYVLEPGDANSILGFCNRVTVIAEGKDTATDLRPGWQTIGARIRSQLQQRRSLLTWLVFWTLP